MRAQEAWRATHGRLPAFAAYRVTERHDAEDIVQDVFMKINKGIGKVFLINAGQDAPFNRIRRPATPAREAGSRR